jgi:uncharacterized protein (TIGR02328 family)
MRLWHKDLITALPREQLVAQWRELSAIAGNLNTKGTPNHILVNKVCDYPRDHFISYAFWVRQEMTRRGYRTMDSVWDKIYCTREVDYGELQILPIEDLFPDWHNDRYLEQCYFNLEEKYDCGGVAQEWFEKIQNIYFGVKYHV